MTQRASTIPSLDALAARPELVDVLPGEACLGLAMCLLCGRPIGATQLGVAACKGR